MPELYIGTKLIHAVQMDRQRYNDFRGWKVPIDENPADEGYLVEYTDGGKANTAQYAGYVSWSPKEQFENAYRKASGMPLGLAIEAMKMGKKVARAGWNGKGMWLSYLDPYMNHQFDLHEKDGAEGTYSPYIGMKTADNQYVPWVCSQTDLLADDWYIVEQWSSPWNY